MLILWIRKKKNGKNDKPDKSKQQVFLTHDEDMKKFRAEHPDINVVDADDILTENGNTLIPVHKVKLTENIQN
jgi:hypothetical protein